MGHNEDIWSWQVEEPQANQRIDKAIVEQKQDISRARVQDWIREGHILVNGQMIKGNYRLKANDHVSLEVPRVKESSVVSEEMPLDVRYEDDDLLVVNKQRGIVVHPGHGNSSGTLVNGLLAYLKDQLSGIGGVARPGIVHRIDKDTSGLLVIAKNDFTHQGLVEQLKTHQVRRVYWAIVHGLMPHETGTIDAPIGRDPTHRQRMTVIHENSRTAVTHFSVLDLFRDTSLLECRLETGRTHQIRVHMKYIGYPLVGDPVYGHKKQVHSIAGQALHARELQFTHPRTGELVSVQVEPPADFMRLLAKLRNDA